MACEDLLVLQCGLVCSCQFRVKVVHTFLVAMVQLIVAVRSGNDLGPCRGDEALLQVPHPPLTPMGAYAAVRQRYRVRIRSFKVHVCVVQVCMD